MARQQRPTVPVIWVDPRRILPLHEIRRGHHLRELVQRLLKYGWQGRPLVLESLSAGGYKLRPSGHYMGWTGTHRAAAARVVATLRPNFKVPVLLVNQGRPSRKALVLQTSTDQSRYKLLRARRDPVAKLLRAELEINHAADERGLL